LIEAIRKDQPYKDTTRGAIASRLTSMGRMAAHTDEIIEFDAMMNVDHEFAPDVDKFTMDPPVPLQAGPDGKYPVPMPGVTKDREY
jgi:hypothetical protein